MRLAALVRPPRANWPGGGYVLAGVRRDQDADAIRGPGIEPLIIDITNQDHIRALATRVHEDPQGRAVRALVNNAGIGVNAPVEVFAIDEWRRLFEVNFFGHIAVIQTLLPALIRKKGSRGQHQLRGRQIALWPPMVLTQARSSHSKRSAMHCAERLSRLE